MPLKTVCTLSSFVLATPVGHVTVSGCPKGVHKICMAAPKALPQLNAKKSCSVFEEPDDWSPALRECCDWLTDYFKDSNSVLDRPLPPLHVTEFKSDSFSSRVWEKMVMDIPVGQTMSYGQLAAVMGKPRAARAVGGAMRLNPTPLVVPCHRVLAADGKLGGFMSGRGLHVKEWLLKHEGVSF
ncbi:methylated-DNA--protein-cysteine methyltransferase-like [Diadema antillarum]|uniref:methylated-DNA--protein-cysteine methyltransferase-like n=1 Tax=Diadema antillarum TaxID=105358 RepID=UPI003A88D152